MMRAFLVALVVAGLAYATTHAVRAQSKDGQDRRVMIINDRSSDMLRLSGVRTTTGDWQEHIIITPIKSGGRRVINFDDGTGACMFDFRAIFRDDLTVHQWSINVCRADFWRAVD